MLELVLNTLSIFIDKLSVTDLGTDLSYGFYTRNLSNTKVSFESVWILVTWEMIMHHCLEIGKGNTWPNLAPIPAGMQRSCDVENMLKIHCDVLQCLYNVFTTLFTRRQFDVFE